MSQIIKIKSGTSGQPSSLARGELAINVSNGGFYFGDAQSATTSNWFFSAASATTLSSQTITVKGNLDVGTDLDVNGTTDLDNTDIDGTFKMDGTTFDVNATSRVDIDNTNTTNGIQIGKVTAGVPISIGHATSETSIGDNLNVKDDLKVNERTLYVDGTSLYDHFPKVGVSTDLPTHGLTVSGGTGDDWTDYGGFSALALGSGAAYMTYSPAEANVSAMHIGTTVQIVNTDDGAAYYFTIDTSAPNAGRMYLNPPWSGDTLELTNFTFAYDGTLPTTDKIFGVYAGTNLALQVKGTQIMSGSTDLLDIFSSSAITNQDVYWSANTNGSISNSGLTNINVGVGTITPNEELTVVGSISASTSMLSPIISGVTLSASTNIDAPIVSATTITGTTSVSLPDNGKLKLGNAGDLEIYHNGSNSIIEDTGTGTIFYRSGTQTFQNAAASKTMATFNAANSVDLNYNNNTKFKTTNVGINVTGEAYATTELLSPIVSGVTVSASTNVEAPTVSATTITTSGNTVIGTDLYVDQIRRYTDNSTTTKINLTTANVIKFFAGNSSNERVKISSSDVDLSGTTTISVGIVEEDITVRGNLFVSGNTYGTSDYEILYSGSYKASSLANAEYAMPGNQGSDNTNWGFAYSDGAAGLGNTSQHIGNVVPFDCQLIGVYGKMRNTATGNWNFALWTANLVDGGSKAAQTWTQSIITPPVNNGTTGRVYRYSTTTGTTMLSAGDSIVPTIYNDSGSSSDAYGSYTILIRRVQ